MDSQCIFCSKLLEDQNCIDMQAQLLMQQLKATVFIAWCQFCQQDDEVHVWGVYFVEDQTEEQSQLLSIRFTTVLRFHCPVSSNQAMGALQELFYNEVTT